MLTNLCCSERMCCSHTGSGVQVMQKQARALKAAHDNFECATAIMLAFVRNPARFEQRLMAPILAERRHREAALAALAAEVAEAAQEYTILQSRAVAATATVAAASFSRHLAVARAAASARAMCIAAARHTHAMHARLAWSFRRGAQAIVASQTAQADIGRRAVHMHELHSAVKRCAARHAVMQRKQCARAARQAAMDRVQAQNILAVRVAARIDRRANVRRGVFAKKRCKLTSKARLQTYQHTRTAFARACSEGVAAAAASSRAAAAASAATAAATHARTQAVFAAVLDSARAGDLPDSADAAPPGDGDSESHSEEVDCKQHPQLHDQTTASEAWHLEGQPSVEAEASTEAPTGAPSAVVESWRAPHPRPASATHCSEVRATGRGGVAGASRVRAASAAPLRAIHRLGGLGGAGQKRRAAAGVTEQSVLRGVTFLGGQPGANEHAGDGSPRYERRPWASTAALTSLQRVVNEVQQSLRHSPGTATLRPWSAVLDTTVAAMSVRHTDRQVRNRNAPRVSFAGAGEGEAEDGEGELPWCPAAEACRERLPTVHRVPGPTAVGALAEATRTMRAPAVSELWQRAADHRAQTLRRVSFGGALTAADAGAAVVDDDAALPLLFHPVSAGSEAGGARLDGSWSGELDGRRSLSPRGAEAAQGR